jgi:hypothetical protein
MAGRNTARRRAALARLALAAALALVLWAGAIAAPFVLAHAVGLHDRTAAAWSIARAGASLLGVIAFLVYLMDRI